MITCSFLIEDITQSGYLAVTDVDNCPIQLYFALNEPPIEVGDTLVVDMCLTNQHGSCKFEVVSVVDIIRPSTVKERVDLLTQAYNQHIDYNYERAINILQNIKRLYKQLANI